MTINTPEENEHVILVAFQVAAPTRAQAEVDLTMVLPRPNGLPRGDMPGTPFLESWWVAEDDRSDGSDNDSAVFVTPGAQGRASALLYGMGLTPGWNIINDRSPGRFEPPSAHEMDQTITRRRALAAEHPDYPRPTGRIVTYYRVEDNISGIVASREWDSQETATAACAALNLNHPGGKYGVYVNDGTGWKRAQ